MWPLGSCPATPGQHPATYFPHKLTTHHHQHPVNSNTIEFRLQIDIFELFFQHPIFERIISSPPKRHVYGVRSATEFTLRRSLTQCPAPLCRLT